MEREEKDSVKLKLLSREYKLSAKVGMKSEVWDKFVLVTTQDDQQVGYVSCKYCSTLLSFSSATTHLQKHVCKIRPDVRRPPDSAPLDLKEAITQKCVKMCTTDLRPFNIVSGSGFRDLSQELINVGADYGRVGADDILPHPTTISRNIQAQADAIRAKMMPQIIYAAENSACACTADFWTDPYKKIHFLTITAHFINDEWVLQSCVLTTTQFPDKSETGENIREEIEEKLAELGIYPEHMRKITFVTDQGPNIQKALGTYSYYPCTSHCINRVLKRVFDDQFLDIEILTCQRTINAAKRIVRYMSKTGAAEHFESTLKQEVDTRWSNLCMMLNSLYVEYDKVVEVLTKNNAAEKLEGYDNNLVGLLVEFLKPFKEATDVLEGDTYPTIQLVLLWLHRLKCHCIKTEHEIKEITALKERALHLLEEEVKIRDVHKIGTFLWPSFKKLRLLPPEEREQIICTVRQICSEIEIGGPSEGIPVTPSPIKKMKSLFQEWQEDSGEPVENNEIDLYLRREHVDDDEPLPWWNKNKNIYPRLSEVARRIFCIPATNAASERNFSVAGNLISEMGSVLDPERVNDILLIRSIEKTFNML